jgi:hypothetical protein
LSCQLNNCKMCFGWPTNHWLLVRRFFYLFYLITNLLTFFLSLCFRVHRVFCLYSVSAWNRWICWTRAYRTGKWRTTQQGWKMTDMEMTDKTAWTENDGYGKWRTNSHGWKITTVYFNNFSLGLMHHTHPAETKLRWSKVLTFAVTTARPSRSSPESDIITLEQQGYWMACLY